jgi:regulator of sigma E protease
MSYLLAFAGFAALIILHEFGHFVAAKAVGMRVERFALFFPPLIFKVRRGETEYGIGAIPLGGYVRITGMNPNEEIPPEHADRAYFRQPVWKRIVVITAGPAMNVLIGFVIFWGIFVSHGVEVSSHRVAKVETGQAASHVLRSGDVIVSIDGRDGGLVEITDAIGRHRCAGRQVAGCRAATPLHLIVRRNGHLVGFNLRPRYDPNARPKGRTRLGFSFGTESRPQSAGTAVSTSLDRGWRVAKGTVSAIARLFYSEKARKGVSGVVGSYEVTRESFAFNTVQAFEVLAIVSLSLAIVNLFPFLPLDGGHIFWALAEKVRGRAIPYSVLERASAFGFLLVIFLFVIGLSNDIGRLRGQGFGVR